MGDRVNRWLLGQVPTSDRPASPIRAGTADPLLSGATAPQGGVRAPDDGLLPTLSHDWPAALWLLGAHGGAGESTLAELVPGWRAAHHGWPQVRSAIAAPRVVLLARTGVPGLLAARAAATQWAAGSTPPIELLGLVLVADAPGRLPRPIRDLARLVSGGVPRTWQLPWVEAWRLGAPVALETAPPTVRSVVRALRSALQAGTPAGSSR